MRERAELTTQMENTQAKPATGVQMQGNRVETHSSPFTGLDTPEEEMKRNYACSLPSKELAFHLGRQIKEQGKSEERGWS